MTKSINHSGAANHLDSQAKKSSNPRPLLTEIYVGGYLLTTFQIGRLCVEAWDIPQGRVEGQGPLDCAFYYLNSLTGLDSPTLVPVKAHCQNDPNAKDIGFILTCNIGYTDIGAPKPDLSLTDEIQAYADRWFPPHIRKSPTFRKCVYVQSKHSHRFTPSGVTERKMNEHTLQAQQEATARRARWLERVKARGWIVPCDSPSIPTKYNYLQNKGLRKHCCWLLTYDPYNI